MNKLLSAASIAIVIAGSAAQAGVVLSDENLDNVTAGATFAINTNTDFPVMFTAIPGMTLVVQCAGNEWTINVNEVICSSCALAINQSGITVTDASGHILYRGPAGMLALPQNSPVMVVSAK